MARMRADVDRLDVRGMSPDAIMESLDLRDYHKVPVAFQDPSGEWRSIPDAAIILDPDSRPVSRVVGADYHVHQVRPLVEMMQQYGAESGLELQEIWKGKAAVMARYLLPGERPDISTLKPGDTIRSFITLSTGFDGLTATRIASAFERLICTNGARSISDAAEFSVRHTSRLTDDVLKLAGKAVEQLLASTGAYTGWLKRLQAIDINPSFARALLRVFAYPATQIREQAKISGEINYTKLAPVIATLASENEKAIAWSNDADGPFSQNQAYRALVDSWQFAPGSDTRTLAGVYHAVTHHHTHGASGNRTTRQWSVLQDAGAQRIRTASEILDSYLDVVTA